MCLLKHAPHFDLESVTTLASDLYGIRSLAKHLPSERDQNFLLTSASGERFVLKIANSLEHYSLLQAQNAALNHLESRITFTPRLIPAQSGEPIAEIHKGAVSHFVRLISYIEGEPLAKAQQSPELLFDFGSKLGKLTRALSEFHHEALHRNFHWDLNNGLSVIQEHSRSVMRPELRSHIDAFAIDFVDAVGSRLHRLSRSVIHGDANDYNVMVDSGKIVGLVDFGDMVYSYTVGDLAIALAYTVLEKPDPLACARQVVAGYVSERPLNEDECACLWWLMRMRLCMSVCLAAYQQQQEPENEYLDISQRSIVKSLQRLSAIDASVATDAFRETATDSHQI